MNKQEQRQEIRNRLKTLKNKDYLDEKIYNNLVLLDVIKGNVVVYNSLNSEVSTKKIVENYKNKVSLFMPKVKGDYMTFFNTRTRRKGIYKRWNIIWCMYNTTFRVW